MQLYILGGHDANENYLSSGFSYNPVLNLTGNMSSMPAARSHFTAGTIDNATLYVIGGYSSKANESSNSPENCSLAYDIADDSWTSGACLVQGRGAACGYALSAAQAYDKHESRPGILGHVALLDTADVTQRRSGAVACLLE